MNLYERVRYNFERDCRKHGLASDADQYATDKINAMTNDELLKAISDDLMELLGDRDDQRSA